MRDRLRWLAALLWAVWSAGAHAEAAQIRTALMSVVVENALGRRLDFGLSIDLAALPPRPIVDAQLRIVPKANAAPEPETLPDKIDIFVLTRLPPRWDHLPLSGLPARWEHLPLSCTRVASALECGGPALARAIEATRKKDAWLSLRVTVQGASARQVFANPAQGPRWQRPRLIVSWRDPDSDTDPAVAAARAGHDNQTALAFPGADSAVAAALPFDVKRIIAGPVFRRSQILLLAQRWDASAPIELHRIDRERGARARALALGAGTWTHLLHDEERDVLLVFGRSETLVIGAIDEAVPKVVRRTKGGYDLSTRPVLTAGGVVVLSDDSGPRTMALAPAPTLTPLWDSADWLDPFTQIVVAPRHGDPHVYALDQRGLKVVDAMRGAVLERGGVPPGVATEGADDLRGQSRRRLPPPLVVDVDGNLHVFVAFRRKVARQACGGAACPPDEEIVQFDHTCVGAACPADRWRELGTGAVKGCIAPVAPPGPRTLACVQGQPGHLRIHDIATGKLQCETKETLHPATNLVADGEGRVYVLGTDGMLRGFDRECKPRLEALLDFDDDRIDRLSVTPDGKFFAVSENRIFAISLTQRARAPAAGPAPGTAPAGR